MQIRTFEDKTIELEEVFIRSRVDGIIQVTFKEGIELNTDLQDRMMVVYLLLCGNIKRPFLFNAFNGVNITREARDYSAKLEKTYPGCATAVIADSIAYQLMANFYLKINKPKTPYKVFRDITTAEAWLKDFIN